MLGRRSCCGRVGVSGSGRLGGWWMSELLLPLPGSPRPLVLCSLRGSVRHPHPPGLGDFPATPSLVEGTRVPPICTFLSPFEGVTAPSLCSCFRTKMLELRPVSLCDKRGHSNWPIPCQYYRRRGLDWCFEIAKTFYLKKCHLTHDLNI